MITADFIRTESLDRSDQTKSIAIVLINIEEIVAENIIKEDGSTVAEDVLVKNTKEIRVPFWYSIIGQYSKEDTRALICAYGLVQEGYVSEARALISPGAKGALTLDSEGRYVDTRNWRQSWLDAHPLPPETITPDNDPLL